MDLIFHEKQEGALCAQHCLNSLLQGAYFNAVDLAAIAKSLDDDERERMAEGSVTSMDYYNFLQQPSSNMDDSGYFSVQVICKALEVWNLEMIPYNSQAALETRKNPIAETAYICNQQNHWLTVRKFGIQWFNLNSIKAYPELISDTYLSLLLAQLQAEGYSIFVIRGGIPDCEADQVLKYCPVTTQDFKDFVNRKSNKNSSKDKIAEPKESESITPDHDTLREKRLKFFSKQEQQSSSSVEMTEEEMLKIAMEMSMQPMTDNTN